MAEVKQIERPVGEIVRGGVGRFDRRCGRAAHLRVRACACWLVTVSASSPPCRVAGFYSGSDRAAQLIIISLNPINTYFQPLESCFHLQKVECKKLPVPLLTRIPLIG